MREREGERERERERDREAMLAMFGEMLPERSSYGMHKGTKLFCVFQRDLGSDYKLVAGEAVSKAGDWKREIVKHQASKRAQGSISKKWPLKGERGDYPHSVISAQASSLYTVFPYLSLVQIKQHQLQQKARKQQVSCVGKHTKEMSPQYL